MVADLPGNIIDAERYLMELAFYYVAPIVLVSGAINFFLGAIERDSRENREIIKKLKASQLVPTTYDGSRPKEYGERVDEQRRPEHTEREAMLQNPEFRAQLPGHQDRMTEYEMRHGRSGGPEYRGFR